MSLLALLYLIGVVTGMYFLIRAMTNFVDDDKVITDLPHDIKTELKGIFHDN